jgi:steroid delta-isomerase-like uncharacterized protein
MSVQDNIQLDEQFLASWDSHDVDRGLAVLSDDVVWYDVGSPTAMRGKAACRPYLQAWYTAFPDMKSTVRNRVVSTDQVATEIEFTGTNKGTLQFSPDAPAIPPTGKQVHGKGTYFLRIRDGKIIELHTYPDTMGLMMQLGLMAQPNRSETRSR